MKSVKEITILFILISFHFITPAIQHASCHKLQSVGLYKSNLGVHSKFREKLVMKNAFGQGGSLNLYCFARPKLQMKSNTLLSEKELVNTNLEKSNRVSGGMIVGELLVGSGGAILLGYAGAMMGYKIAYDPNNGDWLNFSGLFGALTGYLIGSTFGSACGVYVVGSSGNETGSFGSTFLGSVLGTCLGIGIVAVSDDVNITHFIVGTLIQSAGASIGFDRSRRIDDHSLSMINLVSLNF